MCVLHGIIQYVVLCGWLPHTTLFSGCIHVVAYIFVSLVFIAEEQSIVWIILYFIYPSVRDIELFLLYGYYE